MAWITTCLIILTIFASIKANTTEPVYTEGIPEISRISRSARLLNCTNKYGSHCHNDCSTLLVNMNSISRTVLSPPSIFQTCNGTQIPTKIQKCINKNPGYPYCHRGRNHCSPFSGKCKLNGNDFICTSRGYFPNIENCQKFYYCTGLKRKYQSYKCRDGYVYNSKLKNCISSSVQPNCLFIDCRGNYQNSFLVYEPDPFYYVYCSADKTGFLIGRIYKCPDGDVFNDRNKKCEIYKE